MQSKAILLITIIPLFFFAACGNDKKADSKHKINITEKKEDSLAIKADAAAKADSLANAKKNVEKDTLKDFKLTTDNALQFFFDYAKTLKEDKVRIKTKYGNIDVQFYHNTPYHWGNFIYLTKKKYFDNTSFYRVVPNFVIQGGNTDTYETSKKRAKIGNYLLPPDTKKGHKHHRGVISMPSSDDVENPYKFASPYEFFIVVQKPGAYHLDGGYTAFGEVISGMDVVDKISQLPTDNREWPHENVTMTVEILE